MYLGNNDLNLRVDTSYFNLQRIYRLYGIHALISSAVALARTVW
jgi:hypothetical protein